MDANYIGMQLGVACLARSNDPSPPSFHRYQPAPPPLRTFHQVTGKWTEVEASSRLVIIILGFRPSSSPLPLYLVFFHPLGLIAPNPQPTTITETK